MDTPNLWTESVLLAQTRGRTINANPPASGGLFSFTLQTVGGATFLQQLVPGANEQRGIAWQIENGSAGSLQLVEFHAAAGSLQQPVTIEFPHQLFPGVAFVPVASDRLAVVGITASGQVFTFELQLHDASLQALTPDRISYLDVSSHWASLGTPTCVSSAHDHAIVGGSNGPVLCLPAAWLHDSAAHGRSSASGGGGAPHAAAARPFELRESSWGLRSLISGVWQRSSSPAVISAVALPGAHKGGDTTLLVTYDDATVRGFSLAKRAQQFTESLESAAPAGKRAEPVFATACADTTQPGGAVLVVQFESQETLHKTVSAYALAHLGNGRLTVRQRMTLAISNNASVVAAHAAGDVLWVLVKSPAGAAGHLLAFSHTTSRKQLGAAALLEASSLPGVAGIATASTDSMMQALWEGALAAGSGGSASVSAAAETQMLARILSPGSLCRASLRDALAYHGAHMTMVEVETVSLNQLRAYLSGVVATIQRRSPGLSLARCWAALLGTYQDAWARRHPLLALLPHPGPSAGGDAGPWLGTVRGGTMLGVVRPSAPVETLAAAGSSSDSASAEHPSQNGIQVVGTGSHAAVASCTREIAGLLGPLALDSFVSLMVFGGLSSVQQLVPHFTSLLLDGPGTAASSSARDDVAREQHSAWRQRRQKALVRLGAVLGALPDPAAAIRQYCDHLRPALVGANGHGEDHANGAASSSSQAAAMFLVSTARQVAHAQICVARDVLLLLGVVARTRALGNVPLDGSQLAALQPGLVIQLGELLQRASVSYWLCSTAATAAASAESESPLRALATLQLSTKRQLAPSQQPLSAAASSARDLSLAGKLLPSIAAQLLSRAASGLLHASSAAQALATQLQFGQKTGGGSVPVPSLILQLGYNLFLAREYSSLTDLTRLAQTAPPGLAAVGGVAAASSTAAGEASGPELLRGLGLTCRLGELPPAARAAAISEAAGCFFRAAAALHAGSNTQDTQGILTILHALWQQLTGTEPPSLPTATTQLSPAAYAAQEAASLQLLLCEVAMLLFERERAPAGAAMFARAALQHLPAACGAAAASKAGGDEVVGHSHGHVGQSPARKQKLHASSSSASGSNEVLRAREGRLWSNIFTYCVEQGAWQDAYAAVVSNPVPERALDCLRRLVHELSERGEVLTLCSLPLAGALPLAVGEAGTLGAGGPTIVSLLGEAVAALQRRALNTDLSTMPQPYRVLYDFHVAHCDYRSAAVAMFTYARRLRSEAQPSAATVAEVLSAYNAAVNALALLDEADAWLDLGCDNWVRAHPLPGAAPAPLFPPSTTASDSAAASLSSSVVLTLAGLRREAALMRAAAVVAGTGGAAGSNPLQQGSSPPNELLGALLAAGQVDEALSLIHAVWPSGSAGHGAALERVAAALAGAAAWAQLQQQGSGQQPVDGTGMDGAEASASTSAFSLSALAADPSERQALLGCGGQVWGARAAPMWAKLRALLLGSLGEGVDTAALRVAAADAALRADRRLSLPLWLVELFLPTKAEAEEGGGMAGAACGPAALMDLYLSHDRLRDAVSLVVAAVDAWEKTDARRRRRHHAVWLPHQRIEALRARLLVDVERGRPAASALLSRLDTAVAAHLALAGHDTPQPPVSGGGGKGLSYGDAAMAWA